MTCNRYQCDGAEQEWGGATPAPIRGKESEKAVITDEGIKKVTDPIPGVGTGRKLKEDWDNGAPKKEIVKDGIKFGIDVSPIGRGAVTGGTKGAVKEATSPTGIAKGEGAKAGVDATLGNDDGYQLLNPGPSGSDDTPSKDKPKSDDDGKSELQKLKDDPLGYLKDLPQRLWDKLRGKDDDDNQLAKDDNGKDPQGKDTPNDNPEKQPTEPNGQGETDPTGSGNEDNDNPNNPNGNPEPLQVPGAGGGFGAGLGGGNGAGTKDLGDPKTPFYDPLLIALQTGGNNTSISVVSHNEENGGKMLDLNGDGIANNVSWIGKDTGVLFYDENNNHKMDGVSELFTDGKTNDNGEISENGFDYVLKFLDTDNNKVLDNSDENFNKVKVLSFDEDGKEQVNSLKDLEIKSLDLNYNEVSLDNQHTYSNVKGESLVLQESYYTKENGEVGKLADVNFSYDTMNTQYTNHIELTPEQEKVANLKGFGFLRDLNQSATQSEDLNKAISEYSQFATKEEQLKYLDHLAQEWAKTSPYYTNEQVHIQAKEFYRNEESSSNEHKITKSQAEEMQNNLQDLDSKINRFEKMAFESDETQNKLHILQQFYGQADNTIYLEKASDLGNIIDYIDKDYNNLKQDMYENLLFQTRLNPYLQEISVNIDEHNQKQFDFNGVENKFAQVYEQNPEKALVDLSEFLHYSNIGQLDPQLNQLFSQYYTNTENADELVDKEIAKNIMFPDEETAEENNSDELEILGEKISADIFPQHSETDEKIEDDFNDELAYMNYMPDPHYMEQEDKEPDDDCWF